MVCLHSKACFLLLLLVVSPVASDDDHAASHHKKPAAMGYLRALSPSLYRGFEELKGEKGEEEMEGEATSHEHFSSSAPFGASSGVAIGYATSRDNPSSIVGTTIAGAAIVGGVFGQVMKSRENAAIKQDHEERQAKAVKDTGFEIGELSFVFQPESGGAWITGRSLCHVIDDSKTGVNKKAKFRIFTEKNGHQPRFVFEVKQQQKPVTEGPNLKFKATHGKQAGVLQLVSDGTGKILMLRPIKRLLWLFSVSVFFGFGPFVGCSYTVTQADGSSESFVDDLYFEPNDNIMDVHRVEEAVLRLLFTTRDRHGVKPIVSEDGISVTFKEMKRSHYDNNVELTIINENHPTYIAEIAALYG